MEQRKFLSQLKGQQAEQRAYEFLQQQGLELICRNFSCRGGELDLVMSQADMLVFVEVRYRQHSTFGGAAASVTTRKQQKMIVAARYFLHTHPQFAHYGARFDVVAFDNTLQNLPSWLPAAFLAY